MSNVANRPDDMDDALGGDGSLSSFCIMSLSFDLFGQHIGSNRETMANYSKFHQVPGGIHGTPVSTGIKPTNYGVNPSQDDNSENCFKRLRRSIANEPNHEDDSRTSIQNKVSRPHQFKSCLNSSSPQTTNPLSAHYSTGPVVAQTVNVEEADLDRLTPQSICHRASEASTPSESSRSSTVCERSPSPSQSCSSISTHSRSSSRSQSPSDMSIHGSNATNINNMNTITPNMSASKNTQNGSESRSSINNNDNNQHVSIYSIKDSLLNGSTLKESSYTTSVITTTAPMQFKSLHHPFSLKQTLSPYHQFSNSSLNIDHFYDRYLSRDGHQPLQTPLIGLDRTQDYLLKLPPHGPEDDSQKFPKEWPFDDSKLEPEQTRTKVDGTTEKARVDTNTSHSTDTGNQASNKRKDPPTDAGLDLQKGFPFNFRGNSSLASNDCSNKPKTMNLDASYNQEECCSNGEKNSMFNESMKHFNPDRVQRNASYDLRSKNDSNERTSDHENDGENVANQYHGQESMFGLDPSKQKFQYLLAAPISVATKLNEDTMTYLNQAQAYEIKLENMTDVSEAKKGFMCSVINIGFHERHMQQAENELWQQWSQQHPNEKIFSVDMKLSYNVFGVESDGLNKYEFLWDSSKAAGVFIRINSISTEFTPKKHGGEKGVPFKLSIETFSYNSKTHDSYFRSAACCQIKVFKPKGAERKIRSDRDKILKRPQHEQGKYHRPCDHTSFRECSLTSLHPMVDGSLCDYRHSHGHFASKQIVTTVSGGANGNSMTQSHNPTVPPHQPEDDNEHANTTTHHNRSPGRSQSSDQNMSSQENNENEANELSTRQQRDYHNNSNMNTSSSSKSNQPDYRVAQHNHYGRGSLEQHHDHLSYGHNLNQHTPSEAGFSHSSELSPQSSNPFNQMYHSNQARVASLAGINNSQHFNIAYYGHSLPPSIPSLALPVPPPSSYGTSGNNPINSVVHTNQTFAVQSQQQANVVKGNPLGYRYLNEKPVNTVPTAQSSNFKASNLAITSHNNFQTYLGNNSDQCTMAQSHEILKDGTMSNSNYQHDSYDLHLNQPFHSTNSHSQQQPSRQRSSSISNGHCANYMNHGGQGRHLEGYAGASTSSSFENSATNNHWTNYAPATQHHSSANPTCPARDGSDIVSQDQDLHGYNSGHNYDFNHDHYSEHSSPQKNHHQHTNDSTSSCYSRLKSSSIHQNSAHHSQTDGIRSHNSLITINSNCSEVVSWFTVNRFESFTKTFNNFSGSDLLRLSKTELIEICGLIDGIRLYNNLHNQPIKPRRVLYVCYKSSEIFIPIYLYDLTLNELLKELSINFSVNLTNNGGKSLMEKSIINSNASTDSRSSMGALSTETANDDIYNNGEHFFHLDDLETDGQRKCQPDNLKNPRDSATISQLAMIDRLLIGGVTSVKIVATEQVVQMLEDESVWKLSFNPDKISDLIEACLTVIHSKKASM